MSTQVPKIIMVLDTLMKHVPDRVGSVSSEDSQLLSRCLAWLNKGMRMWSDMEEGTVSESAELGLWTEWNELQVSINQAS